MCLFEAATAAAAGSAASTAKAASFFVVKSAEMAAALNMALIQVPAAVATAYQGRVNAEAMSRFQQRRSDRQELINRQIAITRYSTAQTASLEREGALAAAELESARKATRARSLGAVMSGEAGTEGESVGQILAQVNKEEAEYQFALIQRQKFADLQYAREMEAIRLNQWSGNMAAAPQPVAEPDYLGGVLGAGASIYGAYLTAAS